MRGHGALGCGGLSPLGRGDARGRAWIGAQILADAADFASTLAVRERLPPRGARFALLVAGVTAQHRHVYAAFVDTAGSCRSSGSRTAPRRSTAWISSACSSARMSDAPPTSGWTASGPRGWTGCRRGTATTLGVEDVIDAGDGRVVVLTRDHARPKGTDAEVSFTGAPVWTMRDGKVARIEFYWSREEALKAAALAESASALRARHPHRSPTNCNTSRLGTCSRVTAGVAVSRFCAPSQTRVYAFADLKSTHRVRSLGPRDQRARIGGKDASDRWGSAQAESTACGMAGHAGGASRARCRAWRR